MKGFRARTVNEFQVALDSAIDRLYQGKAALIEVQM